MTEFTYTVKDRLGIHARPAGQLVKLSGKFSSDIKISKGDKHGDAKRIFSVMSLGVKYDEEIKFTITGSDEEIAKKELVEFLENNL